MSNHGGVCSIAIIDGGLEIPEVEFDTELEISSLGIREGFIQRKKRNWKGSFPILNLLMLEF